MNFKRFTKDIIAKTFSLICGKILGRILSDRKYFQIWERKGFHITCNNFYQPIPDTRTLKDELWLRHSELVGINMNEQKQIQFLNQCMEFKEEYDNFPKNKPLKMNQYYINNTWFGVIDAEILYCMIRHFKPKKIIEIGSGYSTYLSVQAILKNEEESGNKSELIAIEPYPNEVLRSGFYGLSKLISKKVKEIDLLEFNNLKENDILFIDSSHVLKIGSDVQYEYLEILPRLKRGVIVHLHDIFLPMEYPKDWVLNMYRFWNEQYLLQAFLTFNNYFEILWASSYMHLRNPEKLKKAFNSYDPKTVCNTDFPSSPGSSFWIRRRI